MLPDIQNLEDKRGKKIDWVGIEGYKIPFRIKTKYGEMLATSGEVKIMTDLPSDSKGVNMSRFSAVIEKALEKNLVSTDALVDMLEACRDVLDNKNSYIIISFDYFIKKRSPTTNNFSHYAIPCNFCGVLEDGKIKLYLEVNVTYTSLCPCSKEISAASAHNQRSIATIRVRFKEGSNHTWIEDIVDMVESHSSCPIWNNLKRPDEKYVTERAYSKPMFVEDMIRDIALSLDDFEEIDGYRIKISHQESIHQHNAISIIKKNL